MPNNTPAASPKVSSTVGLKNVVLAPLLTDTDEGHTYGDLQLVAGAIEASVTPDNAIYLPPAPGPVVDPTGCGNTSTGSALYAYAEGNDPLMVGIMANVASAQNIRQFGVIEDFLAVREESYAQAKELYDFYKAKYNL